METAAGQLVESAKKFLIHWSWNEGIEEEHGLASAGWRNAVMGMSRAVTSL